MRCGRSGVASSVQYTVTLIQCLSIVHCTAQVLDVRGGARVAGVRRGAGRAAPGDSRAEELAVRLRALLLPAPPFPLPSLSAFHKAEPELVVHISFVLKRNSCTVQYNYEYLNSPGLSKPRLASQIWRLGLNF